MLLVGGLVNTPMADQPRRQPGYRGAHPARPAHRADEPASLMDLGNRMTGICGGFPGHRVRLTGGGLRAALAAWVRFVIASHHCFSPSALGSAGTREKPGTSARNMASSGSIPG